jgi:ribonuclease HI
VRPTASTQWSHVPDGNQIWSLYFDGSKSKEGAGAGCVIIDPIGNKTLIACRLEFECTNNTAEYEALLQGLRKALDMNIQNLTVFGDSEILVRQVRDSIHCLSPHLKSYQYDVDGRNRPSVNWRVEPVRGCLITQAVWNEPP